MKSDKLKGSSITCMQDYYQNWTWIEDFTDSNNLYNVNHLNTLIDGFPLEGPELIYNIYVNCANGTYKHYLFAITQRELSVSPSGITIS
jgi:hypothetical protein